MPTAYTEPVRSGEITSFREFAMQCSRAFGATILMRDEPLSAEIPEKFHPPPYHDNRLAECRKYLEEIDSMTDEECGLQAQQEHELETTRRREYLGRQRENLRRYEEMLQKVRDWTPPSDDHAEMKRWMEEKLTSSIEWDCGDHLLENPVLVEGPEWRRLRVEKIMRDIDYHTQSAREEAERMNERNEWLRLLRESLPDD